MFYSVDFVRVEIIMKSTELFLCSIFPGLLFVLM